MFRAIECGVPASTDTFMRVRVTHRHSVAQVGGYCYGEYRRTHTHTNYYRLHVTQLRYRHNISFVRFRRYFSLTVLHRTTRDRRFKKHV